MRPGLTNIRECSACGKCIKQHTLASGNTFGACYWTDGKRDAPMLPDQPRIVKCPHCGALVWIDKQKYVGHAPEDTNVQEMDRFKEARSGLIPTTEEFIGFLETSSADPQQERYVRLRAWWAGNDLRRETFQTTTLSPLEKDNLRAFISLLNEADDEDRLMKAEALRELAMFADAGHLLATHFKDNLAQAVAFIRGLNQRQISIVKEMSFK